MLDTLLAKVVGTQNDRELKRLRPIVVEVNTFEPAITALSDDQLRGKTAEFRQRFASGETLDELLPEAFAVVREAGRRVLNMRHFDVQLIGGAVLHKGKIAEMKTGEGKTLVATLPAYLNALDGKGVHVVTVNDYLARRDSEWMGRIYRFLGMTVGVIQHDLIDAERQVAYAADITYGTNNEFGFDYLRDNMKFELAHYVQRGHHFAIVDEVDSILIDEARTPLIISGPAEESTDLYYEVDRIIPRLKMGAVTQGDTKAEERRPPSGGGSQGEGEDRARESDARDRHLPELLPEVQEARRHDRHRGYGSGRVQQDLQAGRRRHPAEPSAAPRRESGSRLPDRDREVGRDRHRDYRRAPEGPSGAGRHRLDREVGKAVGHARSPRPEARHVDGRRSGQARGAEREVPRAGSRVRRAGRPQGLGHDRHEHGRPRHRHPAGRQRRVHVAPAVPGGGHRGAAAERRRALRRGRAVRLLLPPRRVLPRAEGGLPTHLRALQAAVRRRARRCRVARGPAHRGHRAPRGTAHRQPAPRPRRPAG